MVVEKKVRDTDTVISGPTRVPDPDAPDYMEGVTFKKKNGKKNKDNKKEKEKQTNKTPYNSNFKKRK